MGPVNGQNGSHSALIYKFLGSVPIEFVIGVVLLCARVEFSFVYFKRENI